MLTNGRSNSDGACIVGRVTACLLLNESTTYSYVARLTHLRWEAVAKASPNRALTRCKAGSVTCGRRETGRSTLGQGEAPIISGWRPEPVWVENYSDELRVGVKS
jgi:hypothetical protein